MYAAQTIQRENQRREHRARVLRKQRERRKAAFMLILTLLIIFIIGVVFGSMITRAKEPVPQEKMYKYYTNVEIQAGDTLWDLAGVYMDPAHYEDRNAYINEVMKINGMSSTGLTQGHKIILPYYSDELL